MKPRYWTILAGGLLALGVLAGASTHRETNREADAEREPRAAFAAVSEYISAVDAGACPRLLAVTTWLRTEEACRDELKEFAEHRAKFVKVLRLTRDGRRAGAWLATARLIKDGRERNTLLRVENKGSGWKVQA